MQAMSLTVGWGWMDVCNSTTTLLHFGVDENPHIAVEHSYHLFHPSRVCVRDLDRDLLPDPGCLSADNRRVTFLYFFAA